MFPPLTLRRKLTRALYPSLFMICDVYSLPNIHVFSDA